MSKKAKSEVADNSADTVMDGVLSENQAKLSKLNSSIQAAYERRRKIITDSKLYRGNISVYGQESNADTWKMAKMNMANVSSVIDNFTMTVL